jgi:O-antigen ligase
MRQLRASGARAGAALVTVCFLSLLLSLLHVPAVPAAAIAGLLALVVLSMLRPDQGLACLAVFVPIASWIGRQWNPSVSWPETMVVAFCAGYCARGAAWRRGGDDSHAPNSLAPPILLAVALVATSLAVQLSIDAWRFGNDSVAADLQALFASNYFLSSATSDPIDAAMRLLESLVVLHAAAAVTRRSPRFGATAAAWIAIGASAAAALNLARLWEAAARLENPLTEFVRYFLTQRLNVHYSDVNAAGSYFVLTMFAAIGLALSPRRWPWLLAVATIGSSIWIAGSRLAMVAGLIAILLPAGARAMRIRRGSVRGTTLAALVIAILAAGGAYFIPERGNQQSALTAVHVRWELAQTSLRMTAAAPTFGVGVGRYYSLSGEYSSPELLRLFPPAVHENAHNNFLQILGELGIVGFIALAWLLTSAAAASARLLRHNAHEPIRWGLVTGLVAFVLSWLGSHPLLVDEPAITFWLVLGVVCGWADGVAPVARSRAPLAFAGILAAIVAVSIPVRVVQQRGNFNLEHRGVGLSAWQDAIDGVRYRVGGTSCSVFIPAHAQTISLPVRAVQGVRDVRLRVALDGRPADVLSVMDDRWQQLRLRLPQDRKAPRFRRLEFLVENPPANGGTQILMIGKVESR